MFAASKHSIKYNACDLFCSFLSSSSFFFIELEISQWLDPWKYMFLLNMKNTIRISGIILVKPRYFSLFANKIYTWLLNINRMSDLIV